jgi:hypothetical protein
MMVDLTNLATRAGFEETSHPVKTSLVIRASRRDQVVTFVFQRVDVLLPERSSILWTHVGLAGFIGPEKSGQGSCTSKISDCGTHSFMPRTYLA